MAKLIPSLNSCLGRMQAGEKRFARCLEKHLEDDYLCWYDTPVGDRPRYADFIVLHPQRGLLLLEVKDWKLDTIRSMDKASSTLLTPQGLKTVANPLEQVRQCTYRVARRLERDPQLVQPSGRYRGHLIFPYGFGVVLSRITRRQFEATDLDQVLPPHRVICQDEMTEQADAEAFQQRLWNMFDVSFGRPLTLPQIDRIRWHLYPEIRIGPGGDLFSEAGEAPEVSVPDIVKLMDRQQEQLARSLGEGHRVIHGVAGSGKTLILGYRCLHLARLLHKPILVLCYNISLAARLREMMVDKGLTGRVNVYHFHDWCGELLRTYHIDRPQGGDYLERLVATVIAAVADGRIPKGQYGAVMIDEGHDFKPDWLRLVVDMVDPETNSLLLLYDDAQSIYRKRGTLRFSLSSVGIQARGRTTILRVNYRNTEEILRFAYRFIRRYLQEETAGEDHVPVIEPEGAGRHGPPPVVKVFDGFDREVRYLVTVLRRLHGERGIPWAEMCVTYRYRWMGKRLAAAFREASVPCDWLGTQMDKRRFRPSSDSVKLMTMHSSKGLEFPVVAVAGLGYMPAEDADPAAEAKLLYVAMTRSTEKLLVTASRETTFVRMLQASS